MADHNLLSATHLDVTPDSPVRGDLISAQSASPVWTRLPAGTEGQVLTMGSQEPEWADLPEMPAAIGLVSVSVQTNGSIPVAPGLNTAVPFSLEDFDDSACHDTVTNNSRLTVPADQSGVYLVLATMTWASWTPYTSHSISILVDGLTAVARDTAWSDVNQSGTNNVGCLVSLTAGQYVEAYAYISGSGGASSVEGRFQMVKVG